MVLCSKVRRVPAEAIVPLVHTLMRFIKVRYFVIEITTSSVKLARLRKKKSAEFKINNREGEE